MIAEILHKVAELEGDDQQPYHPRPSMAGPDRCIRQMVYKRMEQQPDQAMSGRFLHVMDDSKWHAELVADWIRKTAFTLHSSEMPIVCWDENGLTIKGAIDGILTDLLHVDRMLELKAINHFAFERYWKMDAWPEDYFTQCALYLRGLQKISPEITEGVLLIKSKNTSGFIEYLMTYDTEIDALEVTRLTRHTGEFVLLAQVRPGICMLAAQKFLNVEAHAVAGTLPDRPYDQSDWHCNYCPFNETCWAGFKAELLSLAENGALEGEEADKVRFYKELGGQITDMEAQKKELRAVILTTLKEKGVRRAKAGEYTVVLAPQDRSDINWDKVPPQLKMDVMAYKETKVIEVLTAKKQKEVAP